VSAHLVLPVLPCVGLLFMWIRGTVLASNNYVEWGMILLLQSCGMMIDSWKGIMFKCKLKESVFGSCVLLATGDILVMCGCDWKWPWTTPEHTSCSLTLMSCFAATQCDTQSWHVTQSRNPLQRQVANTGDYFLHAWSRHSYTWHCAFDGLLASVYPCSPCLCMLTL
jgi:hypothetical protein